MKENVFQFGKNGSLVGIVTDPADGAANGDLPGFILVNSGVIHRVGPNRLSVRIARELSEKGYTSCRIDFSGVGDSLSDTDATEADIESKWIGEVKAAMDLLSETRGIRRFVLAGSCSGAGISFLAAQADPRVVGTILINPAARKAPFRYYLKLALRQPNMWRRILKGTAKLRETPFERDARNSRGTGEIIEGFRALLARRVNILLVFCEWDPGFTFFSTLLKRRIASNGAAGNPRVELIRGMNHDFDLLSGQENLIRVIRDWAPQVV
jgi:pimeloyl-ACP methyl ester carboxylesterase